MRPRVLLPTVVLSALSIMGAAAAAAEEDAPPSVQAHIQEGAAGTADETEGPAE